MENNTIQNEIPQINTGLISLEIAAKINGINLDIRAVEKEYGINSNDIEPAELVRIAKNAGFKIKLKKLGVKEIYSKYPLPFIVQLKTGNYAVILGVSKDEKSLLMLAPPERNPKTVKLEDFENMIKPEIIVLKLKMLNDEVKFGFKWLYTEIIKYKKIVGQVLLGSFVIQLFGLITPLFTQVILDKVLVHRTISTLNVLGLAFLIVAGFEFLLNLSRNYIFMHTTNKIDAKLGTQLFKQLFKLYYVYFETRQVGNIAARVRELDRIREFITDKSVSVLIDAFFSIVFLVVMLF